MLQHVISMVFSHYQCQKELKQRAGCRGLQRQLIVLSEFPE